MPPTIEALALAFRRAIELSVIRSDIYFERFPRGACLDSSLLLSEFLRAHGVAKIKYVVGWNRQTPMWPKSHAWLEVEGTIIDITADQFPERPAPPVFVTTNREWHSYFPVEERHPARIDDGRLWTLYARVLEHVNASERP